MEEHEELTPLPEFDWLTKSRIKLGGGDPDTLRRCPQIELDNVTKPADILLLVFFLQAGVYSLVAEHLFGVPDEWHPELDLCGIFVAFFIMVLDSYVIMRAGWYTAGIKDLKACGADLSGGPAEQLKTAVFLCVRVLLSVGMSQLIGIFFMLIVFAHDIELPIKNEWLRADATLIATASGPIDAKIKRETDAVKTQTDINNGLRTQITALQQGELDPLAADPQMQQAQGELKDLLSQQADADKAVTAAQRFASDELAGVVGTQGNSGKPGVGPRRRAALEQLSNEREYSKRLSGSVTAARKRVDALRAELEWNGTAAKLAAHDQLPSFQTALADGEAKLSGLQDELTASIRGRDVAIESVVEAAPDYVPRNDGLLNRLKVLEQITNSDRMLYLIAWLLDLVSFGLELAAVMAKITVSIPSSAAALMVSEAYERIKRIADKLDGIARPSSEPKSDPEAETANPFSLAGLFGVHPAGNPDNDNFAPPMASIDNHEQPKRKRGRPKGSLTKRANGQGHPGSEGEGPEQV